jgi:hypothetical protein
VDFKQLTDSGNSVCTVITSERPRRPAATLCLAGSEDFPTLRYHDIDAEGDAGGGRSVSVGLERPDKRTLVLTFRPETIGLVERLFSWQLVATSNGEGCTAAPCQDRAPDNRSVLIRTRPVVAPRCFGGAARPKKGRCVNRSLRLKAVPSPDDALLQPNAYCRRIDPAPIIDPCQFGDEVSPQATVALIGDSHAVHWRGALASLVNSQHWLGLSVTMSGCRFSTSPPTHANPVERENCLEYRAQLPEWLRSHPEIHTVFLSNHRGGYNGPDGSRRSAIANAEAIDTLPPSVKRVFVLRDIPVNGRTTPDCVAAALNRRTPPGPACALKRSRTLYDDATVKAKALVKHKRVHIIDLTPRFCSKRYCQPVIGGALVHKDRDHMTNVFSTSLGPALRARYHKIVRSLPCGDLSARPACR